MTIADSWLMLLLLIAVVMDIRTFKISNLLILTGSITGLLFTFYQNGVKGLLVAAAGAGVPAVVFGFLFICVMVGAGDLKLLMMTGIYLGPAVIFKVMILALLMGMAVSIYRMVRFHLFYKRMAYFGEYIRSCLSDKRLKPYITQIDKKDRSLIPFSVPVTAAVLIMMFMGR